MRSKSRPILGWFVNHLSCHHCHVIAHLIRQHKCIHTLLLESHHIMISAIPARYSITITYLLLTLATGRPGSPLALRRRSHLLHSSYRLTCRTTSLVYRHSFVSDCFCSSFDISQAILAAFFAGLTVTSTNINPRRPQTLRTVMA